MAQPNPREMDVARSMLHMALPPGENQAVTPSRSSRSSQDELAARLLEQGGIKSENNADDGQEASVHVHHESTQAGLPQEEHAPRPLEQRAVKRENNAHDESKATIRAHQPSTVPANPTLVPRQAAVDSGPQDLQSHLIRQQILAGVAPENVIAIHSRPQRNVNTHRAPTLLQVTNNGVTAPYVPPATFNAQAPNAERPSNTATLDTKVVGINAGLNEGERRLPNPPAITSDATVGNNCGPQGDQAHPPNRSVAAKNANMVRSNSGAHGALWFDRCPSNHLANDHNANMVRNNVGPHGAQGHPPKHPTVTHHPNFSGIARGADGPQEYPAGFSHGQPQNLQQLQQHLFAMQQAVQAQAQAQQHPSQPNFGGQAYYSPGPQGYVRGPAPATYHHHAGYVYGPQGYIERLAPVPHPHPHHAGYAPGPQGYAGGPAPAPYPNLDGYPPGPQGYTRGFAPASYLHHAGYYPESQRYIEAPTDPIEASHEDGPYGALVKNDPDVGQAQEHALERPRDENKPQNMHRDVSRQPMIGLPERRVLAQHRNARVPVSVAGNCQARNSNVARHNFNIIVALLDHLEIALQFTEELGVDDLINLQAMYRPFRAFVIKYLENIISIQTKGRLSVASNIFPWRSYQRLTFTRATRPEEFPHGFTVTPNTNFVHCSPSFRWVQMITYRDQTAHRIITALRNAGLGFPRRFQPAILKLWLLMDIPDMERREFVVQNPNLWTDLDLFMAIFFIMRLDMYVKIARGNYTGGQRRLILAQRTLSFCLHVLNGDALRDDMELLRALLRWRYNPLAGQQDADFFGVPFSELGSLQYEWYGAKPGQRKKLHRPDEMVLREAQRRQLNFYNMYRLIFIHAQTQMFARCERPNSSWVEEMHRRFLLENRNRELDQQLKCLVVLD